MSTLLQDVRYALRTLRKSPGFAAAAILTLALGIGANTAIFSVVDAVVLRPLPFHEPDRLVAFVETGSYKGMLLEFRERARSFEGVESYTSGDVHVSLTGEGEPVRLEATAVTAGLFDLLGTPPALGRSFLTEEEWTGSHRVVVLSHGLWADRFGADPATVGETIQLDGEEHTVVGVMPAGFHFPSRNTRLWLPFGIDRSDRLDLWAMSAGTIVGRLRPDVSLDRARAEIRTLTPPMRELFPWQMPDDFGAAATLVPLHERIVGEVRPALLVLLGAVGLVLLVACGNVANLLLARMAVRRKEMAIRAAIGAGRGRVVRQILTESGVLAVLAGATGLLLGRWGVSLLVAGVPSDMPRVHEIGVDGRLFVAAFVLTAATVLLFGAVPAFRVARRDLLEGLSEGGRGGGGRMQRRLAGSLVTAQMAVVVMLVIGSGLLIRSFSELTRVDPGFEAEGILTATVAPPAVRYGDPAARRVFYRQLLERLETVPGVERVALTSRLPFAGPPWGSVFMIEGRPDPATEGGDWPYADIAGVISSEYLRTMRIRLLRGRTFTEEDRADAPRVALVNEELGARYWPGEDPVGQRIRRPGDDDWTTIVGLIGDTRVHGLAEESRRALLFPVEQGDAEVVSLALRTSRDPAGMAGVLREVVASVDPVTPVDDVRSMDELIASSMADHRFATLLLSAFAGVALVLGAIGMYGVLAYAVNERRHEIGVRMALGADGADVRAMIVREGALLAGLGMAIGLPGSLAGSRLLQGLLYGVSPTDTATFVAVPVFLLAVALLAAYLPARRATRVDPIVALGAE